MYTYKNKALSGSTSKLKTVEFCLSKTTNGLKFL